MSKPANISTQSKPSPTAQISQKSAWARGPPPAGSAAATISSPISRSHSPNGTTTPSHSRKPSGLGPGSSAVPLKDGVSVSRGIVGSNHRPTSSINFGSIDSNPVTPSTNPPPVNGAGGANGQSQNDTSRPPPRPFVSAAAPAPAPQPAKSAITPVATPPVSSTNSPTPSVSSIATSSAPSGAPPKKKLDIHKMFQGTPQLASPSTPSVPNNINSVSSPAVASPQQRPSGLPPPAQHPHPSYYAQQPPHLRSASQSAAPRSPQLARTFPNGALPPPNPSSIANRNQPGPSLPPAGVPQIGSPAMAHQQPPIHQPPPSHHPPHQPPSAVQPPQMQVPMQQMQQMQMQQMQQQQQPWAPSYYYYEAPYQGQPYWTPPHYGGHLNAPQMPPHQHPQHTGGMPVSPRVGTVPVLPPSASPAINTTITPQPPPVRIPTTPLTARAPEFVPGGMTGKKSAAIKITNSQGEAVVLKPEPRIVKDDNLMAKKENRKSTPIRMESEEDKLRRLAEAEAKERAIEAEKKRVAEEALEKERLRIQKEEDDKRKVEEEIARKKKEAEDEARRIKEAEEAEIKRKEEEARLKREEEERLKREEEERLKRLEEERIRLEEEERRKKEEEEARLKKEEEERILKAKEEEERRLKAEAEAKEAARLKLEAEEKAKKEEEEARIRKEQEEAAAAASPAALPAKPSLPPVATTFEGKPRRPGRLDLSSTNRPGLTQPLPSALATARIIDDLDSVQYPEGIKTPDVELNMGATKGGKFKYDRDFLLQFMSICKDKPDMLPPLDVIGIDQDGSSSPFPGGRSSSRRGGMPPPSAGGRHASTGLGLSSLGKNNPFAAAASAMGNFQAPSGISGDRFGNPRTSSAQFGPGSAIRATPMSRSSSQGGVGAMNNMPQSPRESSHRTRSQRGRPRNESLKPSAAPPSQFSNPSGVYPPQNEQVAPLEASANRWVAASTARGARTKVDEDPAELVDRKVKSLLNKLTLEKFDGISDQIIAWANKSENETDGHTLMQVIKLVFEKATDEATWSEMYAKLCRKMMESISTNVRDEGIQSNGHPIAGGLLFRKYLLNRCQEDFEKGWKAKETAVAAHASKAAGDKAVEAKAGGTKDGEVELYSDEYYVLLKIKRQGLGLVKFIGELFKLQMLTERIMHECIKKLLSNVENPEEEDIESLCRLLITVGQALDTPKARNHMDIYFQRMKDLTQNLTVTSRMQFMLLDVIDLRRRNWIPRNAAAAPQTIAQVHEAAAKEKAQAEKESMSRLGREPMSRGGSRRAEHQRGGDYQTNADGWNVAGGSAPVRPPPKAGDLSHFGKINKTQGMTFGPSSVFSAKKDGKKGDTPPGSLSRAASTSNMNMFSMLSGDGGPVEPPARTANNRPAGRKPSVDLTSTPAPETPNVRRKLNLLPRTIAASSEKVDEEARTDSDAETEADGTGPAPLTDEQAKAKIEEEVKEFFMLKDASEAEKYFSDLPDVHKHKLVDKLVGRAFEGKEADIKIVAEVFSRVANKTCSAADFEQGLLPTIEYIDDASIDIPQAYSFMALLLKGSKLSQEAIESLASKINVDGDPLVAPKDKLLKEYAKLA